MDTFTHIQINIIQLYNTKAINIDNHLQGLASNALVINCPTRRATEAFVSRYMNLSLSESW